MSTQTDVQEMYIGLLGRAADKAGYDYWVAQIDAGILTVEDVRANIVNDQPEYLNGIGAMTRSQGVTQLYINLFGRQPEPEGLDYWVNGDGADVNFDQLVLALIDGASPDDRLVLDNRDTVAIHYTDSAYGSADPFDIETARIIHTVDGTPASVSAAIDAIDSGSISAGETFTLTTELDSFTGSSFEDTFVGLDDDDSDTTTLTLGDTLEGGGGDDLLKIFSETDDLSLAKAQITNIESALIVNSYSDWDDLDVGSQDFDNLTADVGGQESGGLVIDNVLSHTAVTLTNIEADDEDNYIYFDTDTTSVTGNTAITVSDVDMSDDYEFFNSYADFRAAETVNTTINLMDIDNQESGYEGDFEHQVDTGTQTGVMFNTTFNVENVRNDYYFGIYLDVQQAGGAVHDLTLNLTDSDNPYVWLYLDDDGNGTSKMDVATFNLDGVENSDGYAYAYVTDVETFNVNVLGDSELEAIGNYYNDDGSDMGSVAVNLDLSADLEVGFWDLNDSAGLTENTLFTITGGGDLTVADFDDGSSNVTVEGSTATGDISLEDLQEGVVSVTTGTGDDNIEVGDHETIVSTGAGDDKVDTSGEDFGQVDSGTLDGGAGADTIAINDGVRLNAANAANISSFEILDVTFGTGIYDMDVETSLKDVVASGFIVAPVTIDNAASDVALSLTAFSDVDSITMDQKDGTGTDDELELNLMAYDADKDQTPEGQTSAVVVAEEYEAVSLMSNAFTLSEDSAPGADDALLPEDYLNKVTLDAPDMATLNIGGNAQAEVIFTDAAALTQVNATGNIAGVDIDASAGGIAGGVTFNGSSADDTYVASANGDLIQGNGGEDAITLGADVDTARYVAASDSTLVLVDVSEPADDVADVMVGFDTITGFTGSSDFIELSEQLGLAGGDARTEILQKGAIGGAGAAAMQAFIGDGVDFFDTGVVDRATAFADDGANGFLFVDANADGNFTQGADMMIELAGVTTLAITDIQFG